MNNNLVSIIMAGGLGKRMSSTKAKVLHEVNGFPMIYHVIQNALHVGCQKIFLVVGKYKNDIQSVIQELFNNDVLEKIIYVIQPESFIDGNLCSLGTGDAVRSCLSVFEHYSLSKNTNVLILSGDVPFVNLQELSHFSHMTNSIMVSELNNPAGYGRVFTQNGHLTYIVEHALCDQEQLNCTTVNAGIYNLTLRTLLETIPKIEINNKKMEFLLTDFYLFTETPIKVFCSSDVPKNINTLADLNSL
jgi:bifunctional UDP-N-acetylglucosamine pyrophosphorylase/glucosamine-1-phosphate N-acetyltransferase